MLFSLYREVAAQKFSIKDFFSKCDKIRRKMRIWSYSLKKPDIILIIALSVTFFKFLSFGKK